MRRRIDGKHRQKKPARGKESMFLQDFMTPPAQPPSGPEPMDDSQPSKEKGKEIKAKGKPPAYKL